LDITVSLYAFDAYAFDRHSWGWLESNRWSMQTTHVQVSQPKCPLLFPERRQRKEGGTRRSNIRRPESSEGGALTRSSFVKYISGNDGLLTASWEGFEFGKRWGG